MSNENGAEKVNISNEELETLLNGGATAANVITGSDNQKVNVFTNHEKINEKIINDALKGTEEVEDLSKLSPEDRKKREAEIAKAKEEKEKEDLLKGKGAGILNTIDNPDAEEEEEEEESGGAGAGEGLKFSKSALIKGINSLIEKKIITPFEGDVPLEKYSVEDLTSLIEENFKAHSKKALDVVSEEFFDTLSPTMQLAATYEFNGGKDLKKLLGMLSESADVSKIDITTEKGQEAIVKLHLEQTDHTPEEIEEELNAIKDRKELEKKAIQYKPKVEAKKKEEIDAKVKSQDLLRKKQENAAKKFQVDVYNVLTPGDLNGIKLDEKIQETLFLGLTEARYPSISGHPTNLLGHLLEKKQFIEPDLGLISEVLWLLNNPEEYRNKLREEGGKDATTKVVKKLKTEADKKVVHNGTVVEEGGGGGTKGLKKPAINSFFKRPVT